MNIFYKMENKEIIEGNGIIAKWAGYRIMFKEFQYRNFNSSDESYFADDEGDIVCDENGHEVNLYPDGDPLTDLSQLPFDSSWELLMPIVEKICRLKVGDGREYVEYSYPRTFGMLNDKTGQIMVRLNGHQLFEADTLIEATWKAVVNFIEYQNKKE